MSWISVFGACFMLALVLFYLAYFLSCLFPLQTSGIFFLILLPSLKKRGRNLDVGNNLFLLETNDIIINCQHEAICLGGQTSTNFIHSYHAAYADSTKFVLIYAVQTLQRPFM